MLLLALPHEPPDADLDVMLSLDPPDPPVHAEPPLTLLANDFHHSEPKILQRERVYL